MKHFIFFIFILFIFSCSEEIQDSLPGEWLIPKDQVFDGGPGKDGIPSIENPTKIPLSQVTFLENNDLVVIYGSRQFVHIYPHKILDWHEIVNDNIDNAAITISYCPLTGSAIALSGTVTPASNTTFGVSGLLYNNNLIMYDRLTDGYWSQMKNLCVAGPLQGDTPKNEIIIETTFSTAKQMFTEGLVISNETGIYQPGRYEIYPYGDYKSTAAIIFPVENTDNRFHEKERILGVFDRNTAKAYHFALFQDSTAVINDRVGDENIVIIGNSRLNFMAAYKNYLQDDREELSFTAVNNGGEAFFQDNRKNTYNILGQVVSGPDSGKRLEGIHSYIAYWFSFAAFYPLMDVFELK